MNAIHCYLREGDDYLEDATPFKTKGAALAAFAMTARELARYDQPHEATLHYAKTLDELAEYPDLVLSLGKYGGLKIERA